MDITWYHGSFWGPISKVRAFFHRWWLWRYGFYLGTPTIPKGPTGWDFIWGAHFFGDNQMRLLRLWTRCVCIYIYNINAFRDHLGIEASGFHASPWTMHIADIYSTEAARFTLQQLQHDQYRQLIGNIYIYMYKMQPCNVMSYEVAFSSSVSFATGWVALFVRRLALSDGAASHFSGRGGLPRGLWEHWNIGGTQNR